MATSNATTELLNTYSLSEIIFILAVLSSAIMGFGRFIEWASTHLRSFFSKEHIQKQKDEDLDVRLTEIETRLTNQDTAQERLSQSLDFVFDKLEILVESDKDRIKAYITDKHHQFVFSQGWIDDFSLDCIERQYIHYTKSGGNSFVDHLIEELRELPTRPPEKE